MTSTAINPICAGCNQPIESGSYYTLSGLKYHADHLPRSGPPPHLVVLIALRLIADRALKNGRENIALGDIEWAIQELEK